MNGRIVFSVLLTLFLLASVVSVGMYAYNLGVAQGLTDSGKIVTPATGAAPYPYFYRPFGLHPFDWGLLSCLTPLFIFFVFFSVMRMVFWRGRSGMHHRYWEGGIPPKVEEWHRKMHEQQAAQK